MKNNSLLSNNSRSISSIISKGNRSSFLSQQIAFARMSEHQFILNSQRSYIEEENEVSGRHESQEKREPRALILTHLR